MPPTTNKGEALYDVLKAAAQQGRDEWARNAIGSAELFEVFTQKGGGDHFDRNGALVSGFSEMGHAGGFTIGVDFGKVICPLLKLEGKVQVDAERCRALLLIISRFPRLHPGLSIAHPFTLACLTGGVHTLRGQLSLELGWSFNPLEKDWKKPAGEVLGWEEEKAEKEASAADRLQEAVNIKCELKLALAGAISGQFRVLRLRDHNPTCYPRIEDSRRDFLDLLGTATKGSVKQDALAVFDLPGFPEAARRLRPERGLFKTMISGGRVDYKAIKAALEAVAAGLLTGEFACATPDETTRLAARINHHLQMLDAFYSFDRAALEERRQEQRRARATLQAEAAGQGLDDRAADLDVDARLCELNLFSHEESAALTPTVSAELSVGGQGVSVEGKVQGKLGYKFSGYRFQGFVRDFADSAHLRAGKQVFDEPDLLAQLLGEGGAARQGDKVSPLSEARRRTGRILVRTQDTQIGYWTRQVKAESKGALDVGTQHRERPGHDHSIYTYNSMTYTSAVVHWRRQRGRVRLKGRTDGGKNRWFIPAEVGSGYSLGYSCDPRKLITVAKKLAAFDRRDEIASAVAAGLTRRLTASEVEATLTPIFEKAAEGSALATSRSLVALAHALGGVLGGETITPPDARELGDTLAYAMNNDLVPGEVITGQIRRRLLAVVGRCRLADEEDVEALRRAFDKVVSKHEDPATTMLQVAATHLNVPLPKLQDFIASCVGAIQAEVNAKTSAVLIESSFALDETHGFDFVADMVPLEEQRLLRLSSETCVPTPDKDLLKTMLAAGAARGHDTLQAIRLRVRRADTTQESAERRTKFKLGLKLGVEVGIELASIERAGHEAVVDLATHWVAVPGSAPQAAAPSGGKVRPSERLKKIATRALGAKRHESHDAAVPPVALLHQ